MSAAICAVTASIDTLVTTPTVDNATSAAETVATAYRVTDQHLVHEESHVVPLINARSETREWKMVEKHLRKGSPRHAGEMIAWLQDGTTPETQQALGAIVPAPVRFVLSNVFGRSYHREVAPVWK